jgi:hypothetical protein
MQMKTSAYRRRSKTVSTVRKSQAGRRVLTQERAPVQLATLGWSWNAGGPQHVAHQRGRYLDPELAQLADDLDVAPAAVLARETEDQLAHVGVDRRPARVPVRVGPLAGDESPVGRRNSDSRALSCPYDPAALFFLMHVAVRRLLRVFGGGSSVAALEMENAVLRHQLAVLRRTVERPPLRRRDRVLLAAVSTLL